MAGPFGQFVGKLKGNHALPGSTMGASCLGIGSPKSVLGFLLLSFFLGGRVLSQTTGTETPKKKVEPSNLDVDSKTGIQNGTCFAGTKDSNLRNPPSRSSLREATRAWPCNSICSSRCNSSSRSFRSASTSSPFPVKRRGGRKEGSGACPGVGSGMPMRLTLSLGRLGEGSRGVPRTTISWRL